MESPNWQAGELLSGGDTRLHYHLEDRGPFPIPFGSFYDTTTQTAALINTGYPITINTTVASNGVYVTSSRVYFNARGTYNVQFSIQLENSDTIDHDANVWLRKNGTDVTESNMIISIPSKHGGVNGHTVAAWNLFVTVKRSDYVEVIWSTDSTLVILPHVAASISPPRPSTPSIILTANLISV